MLLNDCLFNSSSFLVSKIPTVTEVLLSLHLSVFYYCINILLKRYLLLFWLIFKPFIIRGTELKLTRDKQLVSLRIRQILLAFLLTPLMQFSSPKSRVQPQSACTNSLRENAWQVICNFKDGFSLQLQLNRENTPPNLIEIAIIIGIVPIAPSHESFELTRGKKFLMGKINSCR